MAKAKVRPIAHAITASAQGYWSAFVPTGVIKPDGKPERVQRKVAFCATCKVKPDRTCECYRACEDKVRVLEDAVAAGRPVAVAPTNLSMVQVLAEYLDWCRERFEAGTMKYHAVRSTKLHIGTYVLPRVRDRRIHQLDQERVEALLNDVKRTVSPSAARKALGALRTALNWAVKRGYVDRNVAKLVNMPTLGKAKAKIEPLSEEEFAAVVPVIWRRECRRARWLMALIHGKRQTEILGLALSRADRPRLPSDVSLAKGTATIREKIERRFWEHGCDDPHACGATRRPHPTRPGEFLPALHKTKPCRQPCTVHTRLCPPPCAPNCTGHAKGCPQRTGGGLVEAATKSDASEHTIVLDPIVVAAFELDLADRERWRAAAGDAWRDSGKIFVTRFGRPVDPRADWDDWQSILAEAGLPHTRVHDLRHTAATNMLAAGLDPSVVKELMGWAVDMSPVYKHVVDAIQKSATSQLGAFLRASGALPDPTATPAPEPTNVIPFRRRRAV